MSNRRLYFLLAIAAGVALRVVHTATSLGTFDALMWYRWVELIEREGLLRSYLFSHLMNHPPLSLALARALNAGGNLVGLEFQDSLRYLECVADVVTTFAIVRIARTLQVKETFPALVFFLSPATIFITAFHGNTDPIMAMFLTLAVMAVLEERPVLAGLMIAAAAGIKTVALLSGPLLLLSLRGRERLRFAIAAIIPGCIIFLPAIILIGPVFIRNVFGYSGLKSNWGFRLFAEFGKGDPLTRVLTTTLFLILLTIWILEWRRNRGVETSRLVPLVCVTYLLAIFFAPGFGLQYLFWPLPFLGLALGRTMTLTLHGIMSGYLFWYYTVWAEGWPWWYAEKPAPIHIAMRVLYGGLIVWAAIGVAAAIILCSLYRRRAA